MRELALAREMYLHDLASIRYEMEQRGLAQGIEQGIEQGLAQGIEQGLEQGFEQAIRLIVIDYREEGFSADRIKEKLVHRYDLSEEKAEEYYIRFSTEQA